MEYYYIYRPKHKRVWHIIGPDGKTARCGHAPPEGTPRETDETMHEKAYGALCHNCCATRRFQSAETRAARYANFKQNSQQNRHASLPKYYCKFCDKILIIADNCDKITKPMLTCKCGRKFVLDIVLAKLPKGGEV